MLLCICCLSGYFKLSSLAHHASMAGKPLIPIYSSHLGQAVAAVLGLIEDVNRFDCLRRKAKSSHSKYDYEQYMNCLASMKTKVLPQKSVMERGFKEWEQAFFVKNNFKSPTLEDMKADENSSKFLTRNKSANTLLNVWGIRL